MSVVDESAPRAPALPMGLALTARTRAAGLALLVAFLVAVAVLPVIIGGGLEDGYRVNSDLVLYSAVAVSLQNGDGLNLPDGTPFVLHGPVLPALLAGLWEIFGFSWMAMPWLGRIMAAVAVVSAFLIGRKLGGALTGVVFAMFLATSPLFISNSVFIRFIDSFSVTFALIGTVLALEGYDRRSLRWAAGAGGLFALSLLTKETHVMVIVLPLLVGAAPHLWAHRRSEEPAEDGLSYWAVSAAMLAALVAIGGGWQAYRLAWAGDVLGGASPPLALFAVFVVAVLAGLVAVALRPPRLLARVPSPAIMAAAAGAGALISWYALETGFVSRGVPTWAQFSGYIRGPVADGVAEISVMLAATVILALDLVFRRRGRLLTLAVVLAALALIPVVMHMSSPGFQTRQVMAWAVLVYLAIAFAARTLVEFIAGLPYWGGRAAALPTAAAVVLAAGWFLADLPLDSVDAYDRLGGRIAHDNAGIEPVVRWAGQSLRPGESFISDGRSAALVYVELGGRNRVIDLPYQEVTPDPGGEYLYGDAEASARNPVLHVFAPQGSSHSVLTLEGYRRATAQGARYMVVFPPSRLGFLTGLPGVAFAGNLGTANLYHVEPMPPDQPVPPAQVDPVTLRRLVSLTGVSEDEVLARISPNGAVVGTGGLERFLDPRILEPPDDEEPEREAPAEAAP